MYGLLWAFKRVSGILAQKSERVTRYARVLVPPGRGGQGGRGPGEHTTSAVCAMAGKGGGMGGAIATAFATCCAMRPAMLRIAIEYRSIGCGSWGQGRGNATMGVGCKSYFTQITWRIGFSCPCSLMAEFCFCCVILSHDFPPMIYALPIAMRTRLCWDASIESGNPMCRASLVLR